MRILYGVQGTGNGHLARARAMAPALQSAGIDVDYVFSGRPEQDYFDMGIFGQHVRYYRGLTFVTEQGRLKKAKTLLHSSFLQVAIDSLSLDLKPYDLIISDFEPITAWAALVKGRKCLGISHQSAFSYAIPKMKGYLPEKMIMRFFAPTRHRIGLHWHAFNQPILPPIVEKHRLVPSKSKKILVYMGFENISDIIAFVSGFSDYQFIIYAKVKETQQLGHVTVCPLSHEGFHRDLEDCEGVMSNAGFELSSECLLLGKKLLIKPLLGQYEQESNALALQHLKRATIIDALDQAILEKWLKAPPHQPINYPDVPAQLAAWIKQGCPSSIGELSNQLWASHPSPKLETQISPVLQENQIY